MFVDHDQMSAFILMTCHFHNSGTLPLLVQAISSDKSLSCFGEDLNKKYRTYKKYSSEDMTAALNEMTKG